MNTEKVPLPEIPLSRRDDLHNLEYAENADLVLFMAGNQFMVMDELLAQFRKRHPSVKRIFYETLPPGLELKQILAGGARFGDKQITVIPDVYSAVTEEAMKTLKENEFIEDYFVYLHNRLIIMVPEGNPKNIQSVSDLGRDDVRISQPGEMEDISKYITAMYRTAGGDALVKRILQEKREEGTAILTIVHHRETPLRIKKGTVDAGPVWATEVINAKRDGLRVDAVEPGEGLDQHDRVGYFLAKIKPARNKENADRFLSFMKTPEAQDLYKKFGFVPHFPEHSSLPNM